MRHETDASDRCELGLSQTKQRSSSWTTSYPESSAVKRARRGRRSKRGLSYVIVCAGRRGACLCRLHAEKLACATTVHRESACSSKRRARCIFKGRLKESSTRSTSKRRRQEAGLYSSEAPGSVNDAYRKRRISAKHKTEAPTRPHHRRHAQPDPPRPRPPKRRGRIRRDAAAPERYAATRRNSGEGIELCAVPPDPARRRRTLVHPRTAASAPRAKTLHRRKCPSAGSGTRPQRTRFSRKAD